MAKNAASTDAAKRKRNIRSYQREIRKLKNLVQDMTWVQPLYNGSPSCACCGNQKHMGHSQGCDAARLEMY